MVADHPDILVGSTDTYQNWEVADPERWIPHGYVVIRVDSRGTGGMTHADPDDRPGAVFDNRVTLHGGGDRPSWLMLPVIP